MFNVGPKAGAGVSDVDPMANFDPTLRAGGGMGPGAGGGMVTNNGYKTFKELGLNEPGYDYSKPSSAPSTQQPFYGGGGNGLSSGGVDTVNQRYAPGVYEVPSSGTRNGNIWMTDAAVAPQSKVKPPPVSAVAPPPPSSPSVMGFPDPVQNVAPGNPNDVMQWARNREPNNSQLQSQVEGLASSADSPLAGYGRQDPGFRGGDSGMSQNTPVTPQATPSSPMAPPSMSFAPQRPEPVPFASGGGGNASPLAGYGTPPVDPYGTKMAPSMPAMPPNYMGINGTGVNNAPPSLVPGMYAQQAQQQGLMNKPPRFFA